MSNELKLEYFEDAINKICNKFSCIDGFHHELIMFSKGHWKFYIKSGNSDDSAVCVISFFLNDDSVSIESSDVLKVNYFMCDIFFDPLAEDKIIKHLVSVHGKYFVVL